ncbi:MAG TPA: murein biosynthesis integral membrane protein MurJ [Acidimicrobiia bacterium]
MTDPDPEIPEEGTVPGRILRSSAIVGVGTALSRVTGFLRVAAIAYAVGGGVVAGVYSYASQTPAMLYELLLGGVLTATLVPLFVRHYERRDDDATSAIFTVSAVTLLVLTVVGIAIAPWVVELYTLRVSGADRAGQQDLATELLRLFMPLVFFYGMVALATALLNARRRFAAAALAPILNNVVVIAMFLAVPRLVDGPITLDRVRSDTPLVLLLGLGTTAGIAVVALALVPAVVRSGARLRFLFEPRHAAVATMARLSGWTVGYVVANQVALWVVLVLANGVDGGPFLYLSAYAFFQLPHGLLAVSLMTAIAPEMASAAGRGDLAMLRERLSFGLRMTILVVLPAAATFVGLARPIVVALLERGAFTGAESAVVAETIVWFAVGLVPFSVYLFSLRAFYSLPDTRTPFLLNSFENGLNIALAIPLYAWLEIPGLALAFSGAYAVAAVVTLAVLRRRIGRLDGRRLAATTARVTATGAVVLVATWAVARGLGWEGTVRAGVTTAAGLLVAGGLYVGGLALLRVPELGMLRGLLPGRRAASV